MSDTFIFGYGSLVNRGTHDYANTHPARLQGWRRVWRHTAMRPAAFLSAERDQASAIDGLIMQVPGVDPALERREHAYGRSDVTDHVSHSLRGPVGIEIFEITVARSGQPSQDHPIWISYIDVVVQGYYQEYGEAGVDHFFQTTSGWNTPIINDRAQPHYPRHQTLTDTEKALTDHWLAQLSAVVQQL